jgi:hypothetical protein
MPALSCPGARRGRIKLALSACAGLRVAVAYLRVSERRVCLVQHYALRPDALIEIPRDALTAVTRLQGPWVQLAIVHEVGPMTVRMRPWETRLCRLVVERKLTLSPDELCALLNDVRRSG